MWYDPGDVFSDMRSGVRYNTLWTATFDSEYKDMRLPAADGMALRAATSAVVDISALTMSQDQWMKKHAVFKEGVRYVGMQC